MSKRNKRKERKKRKTINTARRRAEQHGTGFERTTLALPEGASLFKLKNDKTVRLDIIPYVVGKGNPWADEGELHYERTYFVHRGIGAEQNSYSCLRKTLKKKCPVCEYRAKLMNSPDPDEDLIRSLAPKERQLFNVIDTSDREKGIQIWDIAWWLFGKALDAKIRNADEDDDYDTFDSIDNGYTLKLGIEENHFEGRAFYSITDIDFKHRKENYDESILDEAYVLDDIIKITPYDELKKILLQNEDDEDNDDAAIKPKSKKSMNKKKHKKDEEEFDEDFEDEELFDEDENDDEQEEEFDEDFEDEDDEDGEEFDEDEDDIEFDEDFEDEDDEEQDDFDEDFEDDEGQEEDFDEDFEDEQEEDKPKKKKKASRKKKKTSKKKKKTSKKKKSRK